MNNEYEIDTLGDDMIELYLDGLMSPKESDVFLQSVKDNPEVLRVLALQKEIDASLVTEFSLSSAETESIEKKIESMLSEPGTVEQPVELEQPITTVTKEDRQNLSWSRPLKMALAASVLVGLGIAIWANSDPANVVGAKDGPSSLAKLYTETKAQGFSPYYECKDDKRFADTFETRHGKRLALAQADMPTGTRMLGLSYLGGISRQTTAMLGESEEQEIIVFVDNGGDAKALETALKKEGHAELNIFLVEKYGLVFAEVSPFDTPKLVQYFNLEDEIKKEVNENDSSSE